MRGTNELVGLEALDPTAEFDRLAFSLEELVGAPEMLDFVE